jgi:hypothetical protein
MTVAILAIVVVVLLVLLLILYLLWRLFLKTPLPVGPPPVTEPPPKIPDQIGTAQLASLLQVRLAGTPADGAAPATGGSAPTTVVWVDRGDEVLVHLDGTATQVVGNCVLVSIDLETDQTGRTPLVVAFALGSSDAAGLVVATDEFPRGNPVLAARWGQAVQAAAWSALLSVSSDHASERGLSPQAMTAAGGRLRLVAGAPLSVR